MTTQRHRLADRKDARHIRVRYAHPLEALEEFGLVLDDLRAGLVPHGFVVMYLDWPTENNVAMYIDMCLSI